MTKRVIRLENENESGPVAGFDVLAHFAAAVLLLVIVVAFTANGIADWAELRPAFAVPILPILFFLAGSILAGAALGRDYPHGHLGACNVVTLLRLALASLLTIALVQPQIVTTPSGWLFFAIAVTALAMDGLDGMLARRSRLSSRFGAAFDMEVDAAIGALLSLIAWMAELAEFWILLLGFMRYGFILLGRFLDWLRAPLRESYRRKAICVVQIGTLAALISPWIEPPLSVWIGAVATLLLLWSFAVDIVFLYRNRRCRQ